MTQFACSVHQCFVGFKLPTPVPSPTMPFITLSSVLITSTYLYTEMASESSNQRLFWSKCAKPWQSARYKTCARKAADKRLRSTVESTCSGCSKFWQSAHYIRHVIIAAGRLPSREVVRMLGHSIYAFPPSYGHIYIICH